MELAGKRGPTQSLPDPHIRVLSQLPLQSGEPTIERREGSGYSRNLLAVSAGSMVVLAQLVRALDCDSRGRRFESGIPPFFMRGREFGGCGPHRPRICDIPGKAMNLRSQNGVRDERR